MCTEQISCPHSSTFAQTHQLPPTGIFLKSRQTERNGEWKSSEGRKSQLYLGGRSAQNLHTGTSVKGPGDNDIEALCTQYIQHLPDVRYDPIQNDHRHGDENRDKHQNLYKISWCVMSHKKCMMKMIESHSVIKLNSL